MTAILLWHSDPAVISRVQDDLHGFPILSMRSTYSVPNMISDPRCELLFAQRSLIEPWVDCVAEQRPAMPIVVIGDDPAHDEWTRRTLRNAAVGLTNRRFLDYLANRAPQV